MVDRCSKNLLRLAQLVVVKEISPGEFYQQSNRMVWDGMSSEQSDLWGVLAHYADDLYDILKDDGLRRAQVEDIRQRLANLGLIISEF